MTIVKHKRGTGIPIPDDVEVGEIAIDISTGTAYTKASDGRVVPVNGGSGGPPVYVDEDAPENPAKGNLWYDTNSGELNLFDGSDWVVIGSCGGNVVLLLPVSSRSGAMQLPLNQDGDAVPVALRSGVSELPLNDTGNKFTVNTRSGDLDLPLMVA